MQWDARSPAFRQRIGFAVRTHDAVELRGAEEGEHRDVGLAVAAISGRIHQPHRGFAVTVRRPHEIAAPEVAMDSRGHLCGSDKLRILSKEPLAQLLENRELLRRERLGFTRQLQVGTNPKL